MVCLGAVQPRKNLGRLLEAWATLRARGTLDGAVLAIAGRPKQEADAYAADAARLGIADAVRWLGYVDDAEVPTLPEAAGGAAVLVDPLAPTSFADGIGRLLTDDAERTRLRELGLARVSTLSWTHAAEVLAGVYERVIAATATR